MKECRNSITVGKGLCTVSGRQSLHQRCYALQNCSFLVSCGLWATTPVKDLLDCWGIFIAGQPCWPDKRGSMDVEWVRERVLTLILCFFLKGRPRQSRTYRSSWRERCHGKSQITQNSQLCYLEKHFTFQNRNKFSRFWLCKLYGKEQYLWCFVPRKFLSAALSPPWKWHSKVICWMKQWINCNC